MMVSINGEEREVESGTTVARLLQTLGAPESGIAVAKNDRVVRRSQIVGEVVNDGDRIEIIRAVAGG
ncbi:MAG: sulfur carrier protein ThiS [Candidatus Eremiobacteraeota bacterium]|nr:sulfur carrier protein ThiS [Candidatus Eremiobacteraeota bacterium]